ncbi:MAG: hypothetical protein Q4E86_02130, partial [Lachnospiraceae bacterium]|nr:hypothetical protein [Lachnospiraceae bacterium]
LFKKLYSIFVFLRETALHFTRMKRYCSGRSAHLLRRPYDKLGRKAKIPSPQAIFMDFCQLL